MGNKPPAITGLQFLAFSLIGLASLAACGFFFNPFSKAEASIYESPLFATAAEARKHITIPLPDEATNIRFAGYREWIAAEDYLRFEAPVAVCLNHAAVILPKANLQAQQATIPTVNANSSSAHFKDLSWFDLGNASNVVSASEGTMSIFIDQDRGVFYYRFTD